MSEGKCTSIFLHFIDNLIIFVLLKADPSQQTISATRPAEQQLNRELPRTLLGASSNSLNALRAANSRIGNLPSRCSARVA